MKFRFVGDGDCPPWVLAALHATGTLPMPLFSKLMTLLVEEENEDAIMECLKDTNLASRSEAARAAAALRWILFQACASSCPTNAFLKDLLLLGVPRPHALALTRTLDTQRNDQEREPAESSCVVNNVTDIDVQPGPEGTVLATKVTLYTECPISGRKAKREVLLDKAHIRSMLMELKQARDKLEDCQIQCDQRRRRAF